MNWKKSILFCVSFIVFFLGEMVIIACGPEQDPYDYYVSFFHQNVQGDAYKPFAFNGMLFLNSDEDIQDEAEVNSAEWAGYLKVPSADVYKLMYKLDSTATVRLTKNKYKWNIGLPDSLKKNRFLIALNGNADAMKYFLLVKKCEPMINNSIESWRSVEVDSVFLAKGASTAINWSEQAKTDFLKLRYAYQAQRMYRYAGNVQMSKMVYEKHISKMQSASAVKGWAMAQYAGLLRLEGENDEAAYLFSKVFANNPERRIMAYRNYKWTDARVGDVLKYAKNDDEKANIWGINGFRMPDSDIDNLKEVYNCNPNHPLLSALLIREVNKLEQNLLDKDKIALNYVDALNGQYDYYGQNPDSLKTANLKHLKVLKAFTTQLANDKKYQQQGFANMTTAYLSWLENDDQAAANTLLKVDFAKLSNRLKDQYRIIELLIKVNQFKEDPKFDVNEFLPTLKWLDQKRFAENGTQPKETNHYYDFIAPENVFTKTTRDFYQQLLAPAFAKKGDTASAALALLKGDLLYKSMHKNTYAAIMSYQTYIFWHQALSEKNIQAIVDLKSRSLDGSLKGFLLAGLNTLKNDELYELQGTAYLRAHDYPKAVQSFNKLSKNYRFWTNSDYTYLDNGNKQVNVTYYANPFIETLKDYPKRYVKKPNGINKKTFAQEMLRLQKLTASDPKNGSKYYYQLANAVYQTGEFGNAWYLISYDAKVFDHPEFAYHYNSDYKFANQAKIWYEKARSLSKDQNFNAKCTYMIAKCEQKKIYANYDAIKWPDTDDYQALNAAQGKKFKEMINANPLYRELKQGYAKTPFYKVAVNECSYLRDFVKR